MEMSAWKASPLMALTHHWKRTLAVLGILTLAGTLAWRLVRPPPPQIPTGPPSQFGPARLVFEDTFAATTLDTAKWNTCYWWAVPPDGCSGPSGELERYLPENVVVGHGQLNLTATTGSLSVYGHDYSYLSGMVTTEGKFFFRYGYLEARIKVPRGQGLLPAFWALAQDRSPRVELDAMEVVGQDPHIINMGVHYLDDNNQHQHKGGTWAGADFSAAYHTIGVDWEPAHITWYVDGVARYEEKDPAKIPQRDLYLLFDLAVGGSWPGPPSATTTFPADLSIKWVKVWQSVPVSATS